MRTARLAIALALLGCAPRDQHLPPDEARALLINRNWLDRLPESARDRLHVFRFVPSMGGGVFQDRTLYKGEFELFTFEAGGDRIRFDLPHTGERRDVRYRIDALGDGERRGPLDLRLILDGSPRGPSVYYGMRRESADLDASLRSLAP